MGAQAVSAFPALAKKLHTVALNTKLCPSCESACQALHLAIIELNDQATLVAYQVVTMVFCDPSVVPVPMLYVDVLDEVELLQEVHGAVHARQADLRINPARAPVHLRHLEVLRAGI